MVSILEIGERGNVTKGTSEQRVQRFEETFHDLAERNNAVEEAFTAVREAMTQASVSVRAPMTGDDGKPTGRFGYAFVPDHPTRAAAARIMFQVLGIVKTGNVTVNANTQTINVSAEQRVAELESVGVSKTEIKEAALAVVDYVQTAKPDSPSLPR